MASFNIISCKMCGKLFQTLSSSICPNCLDQIDKDFMVVRDYLYDNPGNISVTELAEATEVSEKTIMHLLKEKRLTFGGASLGPLLCEICHKPISEGSYCEACRASLSQKLTSTLPKPAPAEKKTARSPTSKMHIDHGGRGS